jgi:hypothetical protein
MSSRFQQGAVRQRVAADPPQRVGRLKPKACCQKGQQGVVLRSAGLDGLRFRSPHAPTFPANRGGKAAGNG